MMREDLYQAYMAAIRRRVCAVCLDSRDDGRCGLSGRTCAIERHLPELIDGLVQIDSPRIDDYIAAIRARVCAGCPDQDAQGRCELREKGDCALDAYLALVIEAVEEVRDARRGVA
jgi:hypothetical protein